jgi:hypothetical protein
MRWLRKFASLASIVHEGTNLTLNSLGNSAANT